jgi:CRISPR-associated protein Csd1
VSWLQTLAETYDQCNGRPEFAREPLPPIAHTTQQAHIEIVLDEHGTFRRASVVPKEESTTVVPCTEESGGRAGTRPVPHPLCDKLQYVAGDFVARGGTVTAGFVKDPTTPHREYVSRLEAWTESAYGHPKLNAILAYVREGRVIQDLADAAVLPRGQDGGIAFVHAGDRKAAPAIFRSLDRADTAFVRWRVESPSDAESAVWLDARLIQAWIDFYNSRQTKRGLCMVTGEDTTLAEQHPAKIRNAADKAKLISSNDSSGFTFRGRFSTADEACSVGFVTSHKAHNALRWLIERKQAHRAGDQVTIAWSTRGQPIPDIWENSAALDDQTADSPPAPSGGSSPGDVGQAFARRLRHAMDGFRAGLEPSDRIVVMTVDSATPGRLAILFYRELLGSEFLDRIERWHLRWTWHQYRFDAASKRPFRFVGAPSIRDITDAALGPSREGDKKRSAMKATVERLLPCIVDGRPLPRDVVEIAIRHAVNRSSFDRDRFGRQPAWEQQLGIACALYRGSRNEEYHMTLERDRTTRDYLYGRLLALAENIESSALKLADETRPTNAARLMQRFADRPYTTWAILEQGLAPYKNRLRSNKPGVLYSLERRMDEVMGLFDPDDFVSDRKLSGEFLLGYHCERGFRRSDETGNASSSLSQTDDGDQS